MTENVPLIYCPSRERWKPRKKCGINSQGSYLPAKQYLNLATMNPLLSRISVNPEICFGKPCIKGHRIGVSLILDYLAAGETIDAVLETYPQLAREDILACITFGAEKQN